MPDISGHFVHSVTMGEGAPVVMIHCALARLDALLPLAKTIDGSITLFDMPGHGQSGDWDGKTEYQSLVTRSAAHFCAGPTHVIGHSFGATAALRLAVERPELVSRLTLIEPVYFAAAKGTDAHREHAKVFRPFVGAMLTGDEARATEIFNDLWGAMPWAKISPKIKSYLIDRIHLIVAGGGAIEEDADGITSAERLAGLNIPVTLVRGAVSQPVIAAVHDALVARIPNVDEQIIAGAGHMVPLTHAAEVAAIIRAADQETA
jgi:lipase